MRIRQPRWVPHLKVRFWPSTVGTADFALFGLPQMWQAVLVSAAGM